MDRTENWQWLSIFGNFVLLIAMGLTGPLPFLPIKPSLLLIKIIYGVASCGFPFVCVPSFARSRKAALQLGFADDLATNFALSSKKR